MNNNYESVADLLNKKHVSQNAKSIKSKKAKTKKSKKVIVGMVALITAGVIAISSGVALIINHFKKKNNDISKTSDNSNVQIDDMGAELDFLENNTTKFGNTTGNINVDELVEKNGKI